MKRGMTVMGGRGADHNKKKKREKKKKKGKKDPVREKNC